MSRRDFTGGFGRFCRRGEKTNIADLTQEQKENISNLAQIASGLAVAAGGGSVSDVGTAVSGSKNAVENNALTETKDLLSLDKEMAARQSVNDLLTGNWGYRAHNYDYPYLGTKEQQEQYNNAYWDSVANKSLIEKLFSSRPMDENEEYYRDQYNIQKYIQSTEWERQVGRPVMNFLPGGVGFVYNATDTLQGSYALGEGIGQVYRDGEFKTDSVLKMVDGVLTLAPVIASNLIPKGNSTGTTINPIPDNGYQIELAPGNNAIGNINSGKTGSMIFEQGSTPNANEIRAGSGFLNLGYDVVVKKEVNQNKVKTQDLYVEGIGKVDVYTPQNLDTKTILRMIEKKNQQTNSVLTQADLSKSQMTEIANRTWGKPSANNINTLFFQDSKGQIIRYYRPTTGAK